MRTVNRCDKADAAIRWADINHPIPAAELRFQTNPALSSDLLTSWDLNSKTSG